MKLYILSAFFCLILVSCGQNISENDLTYLSGYWEIEVAKLPDGTEKEYTINATIDYFQMKGKEGFRKKVMPQFDGSYRMNDMHENIAVVKEDDKTYIAYKTEYANWKEEILKLNEEKLVLKNEQGLEYHYKKPQPFTVK